MQAFCDKIFNWCTEIVSWEDGDNGITTRPTYQGLSVDVSHSVEDTVSNEKSTPSTETHVERIGLRKRLGNFLK